MLNKPPHFTLERQGIHQISTYAMRALAKQMLARPKFQTLVNCIWHIFQRQGSGHGKHLKATKTVAF
jgi:hypothetical protein